MLRSLKEIKGYSIRATDGDIGSIHDFYFDDAIWVVRYMLVDTGKWLPGRKVLLSPAPAGRADRPNQAVPVALRRRQVEDSPGIDTDQPISRQQEVELTTHCGWPVYWGDPFASPGVTMAPLSAASMAPVVEIPEEVVWPHPQIGRRPSRTQCE